MKYCHPFFDSAFITGEDKINTIVIENQSVFSDIIGDIACSIDGNLMQSTLFCGEKQVSFSLYAELLSSFFPFNMNKKTLLNKIASSLEKEALSPEYYQRTMNIMAETEKYLFSVSEAFDCHLSFANISPSSIIKASGMEIVDDYLSLPEKLLDYFELVREFDRDKLFFTVNLRSYLSDSDVENFFRSVVMHGFSVIMFENKEYSKSSWEKRLTVDYDKCII